MANRKLAGGTSLKSAFLAHPWVSRGLRWIVGAVFLYAGVVKLRGPQDFADSIASFRVLPTAFINGFAVTLPPFEVLTGVLLLVGRHRRAASLAALLMTTVFALAMTSALARGLQIDCGCFGSHGAFSPLNTSLSLGRDLLLMAGSAFLYVQALRDTAAGSLR